MTDITELQTDGGKLFLCVVLDLFNKLVMGWSMHHRQDRQMVIRAVEAAVWQRQGTGLVILHSDRGSQFRSGDYQRSLKRNTLICSMSAVVHCGDNAACEGFFGMLKCERINRRRYRTHDEIRTEVFNYIERFHNPRMRRRVARQDQRFSALFKLSVVAGWNLPQNYMTSGELLTTRDKHRITALRKRLLAWYELNGRPFRWRDPEASLYEKICVEVLLQRTRAPTVQKIYPTFFAQFPSWSAIANAETVELEEALRPLGIWRRRAIALRSLASYALEHRGNFPSTREALLEIPAIGQYVANAVLLFQHGKPRPLLDVNMARVLERYLRPRQLADIRHDPWLQAAAHWLVRSRPTAVKTNWAVLDLAATTCTPRLPKCTACPAQSVCNTGKNVG